MILLEWDEAKRASNRQKHKVDFEDLVELFEGDLYTKLDDRFEYGETRFLTYGLLSGHVIAVSHTETDTGADTVIRVISARAANRNEQEEFFQKIQN